MSHSAEILEGFICPICFQNMGSVLLLHDHFEVAHSEEDKALLNQLKGLFSKAKNKILNKEELKDFNGSRNSSYPKGQTVLPLRDQAVYEPERNLEEIGATKSHTEYFKSLRGGRINRFAIETNKILVRLGKLVAIDENLDPSKRKAQEKSIVTWAADKDVNLCMTCGRSFNLVRRRHHCRLCGRVICNKCSNFLSMEFAKKLTNPSFVYEGETMFMRSGSNSSLDSIMSSEGALHLRACKDCRFLIERREERMNQEMYKPAIVQLYEKIKDCMVKAEELLPEYLQMAESLKSGESVFQLQEAQCIKAKLMKICDFMAALVKQITSLDMGTSQRSLRLQQMISTHAVAFVQENFLVLPQLPTQEEFVKLQDIRKREAQKRIAEERRIEKEKKQLEEEILKRHTMKLKKPVEVTNSEVQIDKHLGHRRVKSSEGFLPSDRLSSDFIASSSGWKPSEVEVSMDNLLEKDPILQQIEIIKRYIQQAQQDSRWDEVRTLKENLADLEDEHERHLKIYKL